MICPVYHAETGTPIIDQIVSSGSSVIRISSITVSELTSAFAIKVRTQSINRADADAFPSVPEPYLG